MRKILQLFLWTFCVFLCACGKITDKGKADPSPKDYNATQYTNEYKVENERRVYYLDITASMDGYNNHPKIWNDVKENLISALQAIDKDETEILVIPFTDHKTPLSPLGKDVSEKHDGIFTKKDINKLVTAIRDLDTLRNVHTDLYLPFDDFYGKRIDSTKVNYFFLLTDGGQTSCNENGDSKLPSQIDNWERVSDCGRKHIYGFHIMLSEDAEKESKRVMECIGKQRDNHLWTLRTAKDVNINMIQPIKSSSFDARYEKGRYIDVAFSGRLSDFPGINAVILDNDGCESKELAIKTIDVGENDSTLRLHIAPLVSDLDQLPDSCMKAIKFSFKCNGKNEYIGGSDNKYCFIIEDKIRAWFYSVGGRKINRILSDPQSNWKWNESILPNPLEGNKFLRYDKSLGVVKFYKPFILEKGKTIKANSIITFEFNEEAQKDDTKVTFQFVAQKDGDLISTKDFKVYMDDDELEGNVFSLSVNGQKEIKKNFYFWLSDSIDVGNVNVNLRLQDHNIHFVGTTSVKEKHGIDVHTWTLSHKKITNPWMVYLVWLIALVSCLLGVIALVIWSHSKSAPRFRSSKQIEFMSDKDYAFDITGKPSNSDFRFKGKIIALQKTACIHIGFLAAYHTNRIIIERGDYFRCSHHIWKGWTFVIPANLPHGTKIVVLPFSKDMAKIVIEYKDNGGEKKLTKLFSYNDRECPVRFPLADTDCKKIKIDTLSK